MKSNRHVQSSQNGIQLIKKQSFDLIQRLDQKWSKLKKIGDVPIDGPKANTNTINLLREFIITLLMDWMLTTTSLVLHTEVSSQNDKGVNVNSLAIHITAF